MTSATILKAYPGMQPAPTFYTRFPPKFNFPLCTEQQMCTIIFFDTVQGILHNMWVNYPKQQAVSSLVVITLRAMDETLWGQIFFLRACLTIESRESTPNFRARTLSSSFDKRQRSATLRSKNRGLPRRSRSELVMSCNSTTCKVRDCLPPAGPEFSNLWKSG